MLVLVLVVRDRSHLATTTWKVYVVRSLFCRQVQTITLVTMQPIFLSSGMGAAAIPDDVKFTLDDKKIMSLSPSANGP